MQFAIRFVGPVFLTVSKVIPCFIFLLPSIHIRLLRCLAEDFPNDSDTQMDYRQPLGP